MINKTILVGNLGQDPEIRNMNNGDRVATLNLATTESWKDKASGEWQNKTSWHKVVIFNQNLAQYAERYLKKGSKVYLEGKLDYRKWTDKDGNDKTSTEIVLTQFKGELTSLDAKEGKTQTQSKQVNNEPDENIPF